MSGFSVAYGERASAVMDVDLKTGARDTIRGRVDATAGGVLALGQGRLPAPGPEAGSWLASARRSILQIAFSRGQSTAVPSYTEAMGNVDLPLSKVHRLHALVVRVFGRPRRGLGTDGARRRSRENRTWR